MTEMQVLQRSTEKVVDKMMVLKSNGQKEKYPISLIDINCWEWPQGVGLYGLYKYYRLTGDEKTLQYLFNWYDERLREGVPEKNVNTTSPMLTLTYLYEINPQPQYLAMIEQWANWMMEEKGLIRTGDGCFQHMITGDPNQDEILVDTLFMAVLFLVRAGKLLNRLQYIEEAQFQILTHIQYLWNKDVGLFYHGYNFKNRNNYGKIMWGRGNCWYTIVVTELLAENHFPAAVERVLLNVYTNQVQALKRCADEKTGLWHTVLDDKDSYLEMSASAAFLAGIMAGVRKGILEESEWRPLVEKGVKNILSYIDADGAVQMVSYGTPIGMDAEFYKNIPCCPMTYGQALMILMLQEAMNDFWH